MAHREAVQGTNRWYLSINQGVLRVRQGMLLGETEAGELSFDPSNAQLKLDFGGDGGLLLSAVGDYELEATPGVRNRRQRLRPHRRAEIRMPNNVLELYADFVDPARAGGTVVLQTVRNARTAEHMEPLRRRSLKTREASTDPTMPNRPRRRNTGRELLPIPTAPFRDGAELEEPAPEQGSPHPTAPRVADAAPESPDPETSQNAPSPATEPDRTSEPEPPLLQVRRSEPLPQPATPRTAPDVRTVAEHSTGPVPERTHTGDRRIPKPLLVGMIGLAIGGMLLLYSVIDDDPMPVPSETPLTGEVVQTAPAQRSPVAAERLPVERMTSPEPVASTPESDLPLSLDLGSNTNPDRTERPDEPSAEPEPEAAPVFESVTPTPVERTIVPVVAQTKDTVPPRDREVVTAAAPAAVPETRRSPPRTTAVTPAKPAQPDRAELIRLDLLAADLALAEGRLVTPAEASAYTLYSRVLEQDPDSDEARNGLESVRQALINQALAELAGNTLNDARSTLQAAVDIGANEQLVADLRSEVDYRQWLNNAREGRFDTLYPTDQLVPIRQDPPRILGNLSSGTDASVEVQFTITSRGNVRGVEVADGTSKDLATAVQRAVRKWRFEPVLYEGRAIPVRSSAQVTFQD